MSWSSVLMIISIILYQDNLLTSKLNQLLQNPNSSYMTIGCWMHSSFGSWVLYPPRRHHTPNITTSTYNIMLPSPGNPLKAHFIFCPISHFIASIFSANKYVLVLLSSRGLSTLLLVYPMEALALLYGDQMLIVLSTAGDMKWNEQK